MIPLNFSLNFRKQVPVILQIEAAECGLACLAMVLNYHGHLIDLASLRRRESISLKGVTLKNIIDAANRVGLSTRALRLDMEDLPKLRLPCILHWSLNHFVVLTKVTSKKVIINDPAHGKRVLSLEEVSREFTGVALELIPNENFERGDERANLRIRDLFKHVRSLKATLIRLFLLSLGLEIIAIVMPIVSQVVIDEVIVTNDYDLLTTIAVGVGILILLQMIIASARTWMVMLFGTVVGIQWSTSLFSHLTRLPLDYFMKRHVGDVLSRFSSLGSIQKTLTTDMVQAIMDGIMAIGMAIMLIIYGKWLAAVTFVAVILDLILRLLTYDAYRRASQEGLVYDARQQSHFIETLRSMASVKLLNLRERRQSKWLNLMIDSINVHLTVQKYDLVFGRAKELIFSADRIIMMVLGAHMVMEGKMSVGMLVAFLSYKDQFTGRIGSLISAAFNLRMLSVQTDRLSDIAMTKPETDAITPAPILLSSDDTTPRAGTLDIRNASVRYSDAEPWIYHNVSLTIPAGKSVAIIGPSGGGKTTLLKTMMSLIQPNEGTILYNGINIETLSLPNYRDKIAGVLQDDGLFTGSIADNISGFADNQDEALLIECAKRAAIYDDIMEMPMKFETLLGDMGNSLSGGQKQRVILARALYRRPEILFLDEATSHLDEATEAVIAESLRDLQMTRVIVAHRPATVAHADIVVVVTPETAKTGQLQIIHRDQQDQQDQIEPQ
ncbi:peptidase domain-containing ABC transporter [Entomobacter blattae]|uniref:Lactococcin-G-processing and transport ATP-binding protein LagD n=1 Tax=Entomobacter blattae TaxID=2762277 RepID=A0A7H1NT89_9PROT|nr:peptidase domain-containing ABC transporter [Entomobacter blattae]QNT78999.1 Lactococcin-G-processing and transport ATP-binding protein LagD [Entomobacter blattae]